MLLNPQGEVRPSIFSLGAQCFSFLIYNLALVQVSCLCLLSLNIVTTFIDIVVFPCPICPI